MGSVTLLSLGADKQSVVLLSSKAGEMELQCQYDFWTLMQARLVTGSDLVGRSIIIYT